MLCKSTFDGLNNRVFWDDMKIYLALKGKHEVIYTFHRFLIISTQSAYVWYYSL
ncbi:hypothetical protein MTR_8g093140 [Medicago truncatula]|uniref:Uncharacterized protein n=1 Tax=Medicago truncatula TaxID=3880 RepID=G7LD60_MEDTR|nr:hypothetical protein MTR_8g093140 [Medicago truncatula]